MRAGAAALAFNPLGASAWSRARSQQHLRPLHRTILEQFRDGDSMAELARRWAMPRAMVEGIIRQGATGKL